MEAFNKELANQLFKSMDAQEFQDPEKILAIWVKNLISIVNEMSNRKSMMISMKPKDAIKLDIVKLDNSETYPENEVLPEDGFYMAISAPRMG